jgi:hypothetical protein
MKIEEKPPEPDAGSPPDISAQFYLETENSNLRRLVVELLEKNQQLREQLRMLANDGNSEISSDLAARHRVDPRAA